MSAKTVVAKLRDLASVPSNRAAIVQDQGCLPGLILFLDHADRAVVVLALQALQHLSLCESNRSIMARELGLLVSLNMLAKTGAQDEQALAAQIKQNLEAPAAPKPAAASTATAAPTQTNTSSAAAAAAVVRNPLETKRDINTNTNSASTTSSYATKKTPAEAMFMQPPQNSFFVGVQNKKAKTVVLQLRDFNDSVSRSMVEEALLAVRGVISFTCDMDIGRVTIRIKPELSVDTLFSAVLNVDEDLAPRQVVKNLQGEEIFLESTVTRKEIDDENEPQYLEEDEDAEETMRRSAVTRKGGKMNKTSSAAHADSSAANASGGWFDGISAYARSWWS